MLKGLSGLGDMTKLMKQAQEMQSKMADAQAKMEDISAEGEAGAGMVKATVSAKGELRSLEIDPNLFTPEDKEIVEDLIIAAVKDAHAKAAEAGQAEMAKVTEGFPMPEGMKLPF